MLLGSSLCNMILKRMSGMISSMLSVSSDRSYAETCALMAGPGGQVRFSKYVNLISSAFSVDLSCISSARGDLRRQRHWLQ